MGHMPTLAVVIPAKNEEQSLPFLLSALRKQHRQPDELIVADAGSSDKTRVIAKRFGARVVRGGMPGKGRNRGADKAKSDLILFLDADVTLLSHGFIQQAVAEFIERDLDIATVSVCLPDGTAVDRVCHDVSNLYARAWGEVWPHARGCCTLVKRSLHQAIGGYDERALLGEDCEYAVRAAKQGKFGFLNSVKVGLDTRRLDHDGRVRLALKYILAEFHSLLIGPIYHDAFKYHFDYDESLVKKIKEKIILH